jgi:hypothetical protein
LLEVQSAGARVDLIEATATGSERVEKPPAADGQASACRLVALDHTRIEARCSLVRAGHVIFVEQHGAGWTATVDGAPAPIQRANLIMRAVPAPAGERTVVLQYAPPRLRAGLAAGAIGLVFVLAALLSLGWHRLGRWRISNRDPGHDRHP